MYLACSSRITSGSQYVVSAITWHQWHHTASRSSSTNRFSRLACSNTPSDQPTQVSGALELSCALCAGEALRAEGTFGASCAKQRIATHDASTNAAPDAKRIARFMLLASAAFDCTPISQGPD